ncbi:MAG: hypothetical protein ACTSQY_08010, partial [Candidatus Odinarchaeia archaeon]
TIINIKQGKVNQIDRAIKEFRAGKIFGKKLKEAEKSPWYKLAALIAEYYETKNEDVFNEAKLIYTKLIDKKDKFVTNFFKEIERGKSL